MDEPKKRLRLLPPKDHFYVPSNDASHKSAKITFRLIPSMVRQIEIATRQGNPFGWQTPSDCHRWVTKIGLDRIAEMMDDPFLSNLNQQTNAITQILNDEIRQQQQAAAFDTAENVIRGYKLMQDYEAVRITLQNLKREIDLFNDRRVRERWQTQFEERFGHLLGKPDNQ